VFSPAPDLVAPTSAALRVASAGMLISIPGEIWISAVMGTGDTVVVFVIELVRSVVMLVLAYIAAVIFGWSVALIWLSVVVAWLFGLGLAYGWMKAGFWKRLEI